VAWNVSSFVQEGFEKLRSDYAAGKQSRFRRNRAGVTPIPRHADYHYRMEIDFFRMMELFRDYDRNDTVVGQGITRVCDNVLQESGITPDAATPDPKLNEDLNARWNEEADNPDVWDLQAEQDFHGLENDVLRAMLVDGDMFALPNRSGAVELAEGHRCRTPLRTRRNIIHGVEVDPVTRRRLRYWFCDEDVNPLSSAPRVSDMRCIRARDAEGYRQVLQIYRRKRVSQSRGVSALAPIVDIAGMHDDLQFCTLVKAQVSAAFVIFEEFAVNAPGMGRTPVTGTQYAEVQDDGSLRSIEGIAPGMRVRGQPGQKLQGFAPNVPCASFVPHSILILTFIAMNLGIPIAVLLLDPKLAGNFSSLRGVMDQAKIGLRKLQKCLISKWHRPVRQFRLRHWATQRDSDGRRFAKAWDVLGPAFFACKWRPPRWPYIEPITDASAAILRTRNLQQSPRRCAAEAGDDFAEIVNETCADNAYAIISAKKKAAEINAQFPGETPVDWREILSLPTPDRVNVSLTGVMDAANKGGEPSEAPESQLAEVS
jgi:capsid protein